MAVILLAIFVIFLQLLTTVGDRSSAIEVAPPSPLPRPIIHPQPQQLTKAKLVSVVDGDTIRVVLPGDDEAVTIRYYGIDTPERGEPCYREARQRNRELVSGAVLLLSDARDKDRYNRLLRYIFREDGMSIDALLVLGGYARAWREDGAYRGELLKMEEAARNLGIGCLWRKGGD